MADFLELRSLSANSDLKNKVEVAIWIAANEIFRGGDTTEPYSQEAGAHDLRVKWANSALRDKGDSGDDVLRLLLAENEEQSVTTIEGSSDATILTNTKAVIDGLAAAQFGA